MHGLVAESQSGLHSSGWKGSLNQCKLFEGNMIESCPERVKKWGVLKQQQQDRNKKIKSLERSRHHRENQERLRSR